MKKVLLVLCLLISFCGCSKDNLFKYGEKSTIKMSDSSKVVYEKLQEEKSKLYFTEEVYPSLIESVKDRTEIVFPDVKTNNKIEKIQYQSGDVYKLVNENAKGIVLYIHGGAYVYEADAMHVDFCDQLVDELNVEVYMPNYKLAPQNTYKEAYDLLYNLYMDLLQEKLPIYIMGDSAGGGLALAFTQFIIGANRDRPKKLVLISPWVDVTLSNPDIKDYEDIDLTISTYAPIEFGKLWAGDLDTKDPMISPLYGSFLLLPDTLIFCGTDEVVLPDILLAFDSMKEVGVNVSLIMGEKFWHVFPIYDIEERNICISMIKEHINK